MRLAERHREPLEAHFTEGEPDLEPPEELAIGELDDEAILEEELDNEDLLEQDVDEDTLEASLEDLVHGNDADDDGVDDAAVDGQVHLVPSTAATPIGIVAAELDDADDDLGDEDLEESLDLVLLERLALLGDGEAGDEDDDPAGVRGVLLQMQTDTADPVDVAPCGVDEFVCRSCFLVRRRVQLADATAMACLDCCS